jgi:hypothetical protein
MNVTTIDSLSYSDCTASMQPDTEARHLGDAASASSLQRFPLEDARCSTHTVPMEWVPARERAVVPTEMAALCRRCPGRQACLLWALAGQESGYWAGTTTADRDAMLAAGDGSLQTADTLQREARSTLGIASHPPGEGSFRRYRAGCRCPECQQANAAQRANERERARRRRSCAA